MSIEANFCDCDLLGDVGGCGGDTVQLEVEVLFVAAFLRSLWDIRRCVIRWLMRRAVPV